MMALGFEIPAVALRKSGAAPVVPFSPLQLSPSAMFDPADTAKLFQDDVGSRAVTADNQPVGLWQDASSNALDISQSVSAARPSYRTDGTHHWIEMDGVDDSMISAPALRVGNPMTMVIGYQMLSTVGSGRVNFAEVSKKHTTTLSFGARPSIDRLQFLSRIDEQGAFASQTVAASPWGGHTKHVATVQATSGQVVLRLDGVVVKSTTQNLTNEYVDTQPLRVGLGKGASIPGAFRLFGLQVWHGLATQPSLPQVELLESWMADRIGVTL